MTHIIPKKGTTEYLRQELNRVRTSDNVLYWEISMALLRVQMHNTDKMFWNFHHPLCEHDLRVCPICHVERDYDPRRDYPAPAVQ